MLSFNYAFNINKDNHPCMMKDIFENKKKKDECSPSHILYSKLAKNGYDM